MKREDKYLNFRDGEKGEKLKSPSPPKAAFLKKEIKLVAIK